MNRRDASMLVAATLLSTTADAGIVDLLNGVKVGGELPPHDFSYLSERPPVTPLRLIVFWATWCSSCLEEVPRLNAFHAKYLTKGIAVIGVSSEPRSKVVPVVQQRQMQYFTAVEGTPSLHGGYGVTGFPYSLVANQRDVVVWRGQPRLLSDDVLDTLLKRHVSG